MADYLVLDNHLVCSSLRKAVSPISSLPQLPVSQTAFDIFMCYRNLPVRQSPGDFSHQNTSRV